MVLALVLLESLSDLLEKERELGLQEGLLDLLKSCLIHLERVFPVLP